MAQSSTAITLIDLTESRSDLNPFPARLLRDSWNIRFQLKTDIVCMSKVMGLTKFDSKLKALELFSAEDLDRRTFHVHSDSVCVFQGIRFEEETPFIEIPQRNGKDFILLHENQVKEVRVSATGRIRKWFMKRFRMKCPDILVDVDTKNFEAIPFPDIGKAADLIKKRPKIPISASSRVLLFD